MGASLWPSPPLFSDISASCQVSESHRNLLKCLFCLLERAGKIPIVRKRNLPGSIPKTVFCHRWRALVWRPWTQGQDKGQTYLDTKSFSAPKCQFLLNSMVMLFSMNVTVQSKIQVDEFLDFWQSSLNPAALALVQNVLMYKLFFRFKRFPLKFFVCLNPLIPAMFVLNCQSTDFFTGTRSPMLR